LEQVAVRLAVRQGQRDANVLSNIVFFHRHPERAGRKLLPGERGFSALTREWLAIRDSLVRPALQALASTQTGTDLRRGPATVPAGPLGTLSISANGRRPFIYPFTMDDVLWTARFLVGEAGGRDDPRNHAVIWAMFNRYALFTHRVYPTFHAFLRAYSTPLQPVLRSAGAARRHVTKRDFVRTGGVYPGTSIPKGQLGTFLKLQRQPWSKLPAATRALAQRALSGALANPGIGNASEFADTAVYFRDRYGRRPTEAQWREFSIAFPGQAGKNWTWIGDIPGLVQYQNNTFYLDNRARALPPGAIRVLPPRAP
jgi:hypothetical protein